MNRRDRRAQARRRQSIVAATLRTAMQLSDADGKPWMVYGFTGACRDCTATATLSGRGSAGPIFADIYHDEGCPAAAGTVRYQPVPL